MSFIKTVALDEGQKWTSAGSKYLGNVLQFLVLLVQLIANKQQDRSVQI